MLCYITAHHQPFFLARSTTYRLDYCNTIHPLNTPSARDTSPRAFLRHNDLANWNSLAHGARLSNTANLALTAQPPATPSWGRWPQHHPSSDYLIVDATGMMQYDSRSLNSGPLQRPVMGSPQYVMSNAYSAAPMTTMATTSYDPQPPFGYGNYAPSSPAVAHSFKPQFTERPTPRVMPSAPELDRGLTYPRSCSAHEQSRSPSLKSEPMSAVKSRNNSITTPKTIKANISVKSPNEATFSTDIDILMKAIQAKKEQEELGRTERIPSPPSDHELSQVCFTKQ